MSSKNLIYYANRREGCHRHKWTPIEEYMVLKHEISDTELSKQIGHSVQAIQIKRARLKECIKILGLADDHDMSKEENL